MSCQTCRNNNVYLSRAKGDLAAAARKAARVPSDRNIATVTKAKQFLADTKAAVESHEQSCELVAA